VYGTKQTVVGALSSSEMSYASPDHKEGVYVFRLYPPRTTTSGAQISLSAMAQEGVTYAVNVLRGIGLPRDTAARTNPVSASAIWGPYVTGTNYAIYHSASTSTAMLVGSAVVAPPADLDQSSQDKFIASAVQRDYAVAVTIVYGPFGPFWVGAHALGLQIFDSWSLLGYG
jgi:hypothetical protein